MKYFLDSWEGLKKKFDNKNILLFLDYDGTLTPIVETPARAVIPFEVKRLLGKLTKLPGCRIAIISARALRDIKKLVGIEGITYVGNHGLEIEGPKIKFSRPSFDIRRDPAIAGESLISLRYKSVLQDIKDELNVRLTDIRGAFIEDKNLSLSLHYRLADRSQIPRIKTALDEVTAPYTIRNKIKIKVGKKVFEIRPAVEWDKGKVILWLLARWKFMFVDKDIIPVYIGDDVSDEDAFKALRKYLPAGRQEGITIFVGETKRSSARYYLKDTQEVKDFLGRIKELLEKRR